MPRCVRATNRSTKSRIKGDGEAHPLPSPDDEFADFETFAKGNVLGAVAKSPDMLPKEYARSALKEGLRQEEKLGANPFKFGMVGSTDAHTGMPTTREDNNFGKLNIVEPSAERFEHFIVKGVKPELSVSERYRRLRPRRGLGLRKHPRIRLGCHEAPGVYATTGSCILVRVFAGWDFTDVEVERPDFAREGYARGVPMRR